MRRVCVVIWKRTIAAALGVIAVLVSLIAFANGGEYVRNPFWFAVFGHAVMWFLGLGAVGVGIRLLRFAWSGGSRRSGGWLRPLLLGIGFFFPGFIFSLPFTMLWSNQRCAGEAHSGFGGIEVSFYIGIAAAIICCTALLKKRNFQPTP